MCWQIHVYLTLKIYIIILTVIKRKRKVYYFEGMKAYG